MPEVYTVQLRDVIAAQAMNTMCCRRSEPPGNPCGIKGVINSTGAESDTSCPKQSSSQALKFTAIADTVAHDHSRLSIFIFSEH
jgi:hypothetical protein